MSSPATYLPPGFAVPIDLDLSKNEGRSRAEELLDAIDDPRRLVGRYPDTSPLRAKLAALHGLIRIGSWSQQAGTMPCPDASWLVSPKAAGWSAPTPPSR